MARYLLSVYGATNADEHFGYSSGEEMEQALADTGAFNDMLEREGYFVFADGLEAASTATTVDGQGSQPVLTDGPYLETKEHLAGFWVIEAPNLDVALDLAAQGSKACRGVVEVRPFNTAATLEAIQGS